METLRRRSARSGRLALNERARRVEVEPADPHDRQIRPVEQGRFVVACREDDRDRVGDQAPQREAQSIGARAVEPVRVVDQDEQRRKLGMGC